MEIRPGATAEVALTVTSDRTADVLGNPGVAVLATPFLIGLLEQAAGALIHPHLPPGASTGPLIPARIEFTTTFSGVGIDLNGRGSRA